MSDRRGHRKLCLYSNRCYEKRKYFPKKLIVFILRSISLLRVSMAILLCTSSPLLIACHNLHLLIQNLQFHHWTFYVTGCNVWELYLKVSKTLFLHLSRQLFRMESYNPWRNSLSIYWVIATEIGLVTGLSVLNIKADFMWIFSCYQLAPQEHCGLLENLPISISSGKEIWHHNSVISIFLFSE